MTAADDPMRAAAFWLAAQPEPIPHVIPALKERFGLTGLQACQAIALARNITPQPGGQNDERRD